MLNNLNLSDKTYEELLAEAIAQIPLYSREWTNFNPSDPGITILQNLTAFQLVQQEDINNVPEEVRRKLLKLVGYIGKENQAATVLVQAPSKGGPILPEGHQLWSGTIPFETTESVVLSAWGVSAVFAESGETYRDLTRFLEGGTAAYPFGRDPEAGDAFVCVLNGIPEMGEPLRIWLQVAEEELRTPFEDEMDVPDFSNVRWQYYTASGWQDARFQDETIGLLRSGAVTLWLEQDLPTILETTPVQGCALRCVLETADYDRTPRLQALAAHLFPMKQQNTCVQCVACHGGSRVNLRGRLPQMGNLLVFCKETQDGPYFLYQRALRPDQQGRFYRSEETLWGVTMYFDLGFEPCDCDDAVRVVCYDEDMIHHRQLGAVYGYDHQEIQIDLVKHVLPESFLLALEVPQRSGPSEYRFVRPGETTPEGFSYRLRSGEARVIIDEPGLGGCRLLLAHCAVTQGSRGNLRAGAVLEQRGGYDGTEVEARYVCPAPGRGGVSQESEEELRARFSADMRRTDVAVRTQDYEALVHQTPGLCIHKVKAVASGNKNLVKIAVKPYTEGNLPKLTKDYVRQIEAWLEPRRLLTTRFEICQPRYVPVSVNVTLSIRGINAYAREETERMLRAALDYVNGPQEFGSLVRFNEIYQKLSGLPFVEAVDALSLFPESRDATMVGSDIHLDDDSLCYPGTIRLTLREHGR